MGSPQQRISPSKESRRRQIRNPKTQENHHPPTAFLQNRILAHVKSPRRINRFRILHGRLVCSPLESCARSRCPISLRIALLWAASRSRVFLCAIALPPREIFALPKTTRGRPEIVPERKSQKRSLWCAIEGTWRN